MAAQFPISPTDGQYATVNNIIYQYSAASSAWTRVLTTNSAIINGTSQLSIATTNGNANLTVDGTSNVAVWSSTGQYINGFISATGNITGNYFIGNGSLLTGVSGGTSITFTAATVPPGTANVLDQWYDTDTGALYEYTDDGASSYWIDITGPLIANPATPSGEYGNGNVVTLLASFGSNPISTTGNITAGYFLGNGSLLTGISNINRGNSNVTLVSGGGNATVNIGGTANVAVFAATGAYVTGVISVSGNITAGNINATGMSLSGNVISPLNVTGNITGGNINTPGVISAMGNVSGGNVNAVDMSLSGNVISPLNVTGNITGGNVNTVDLSLSGNVISALNISGNVTANNITVANIATVNVAAVTTANVTTANTVSLTVTGNQTFQGSQNRIRGDFSNTTVANRVAFQTTTTDGNTNVGVIPNGASTTTAVTAYNSTDPDNAAFVSMGVSTVLGEARITAGITGTGSYVPLTVYTGGVQSIYLATDGKIGFGSSVPTVSLEVDGTDAVLIAKGNTAQQPVSPATGMIRYNSQTNQFEGYGGVSPAWGLLGGPTVTNDTATAANLYPLFANTTSGTPLNLYTSNAKLLYNPSTGELQSSIPVATNGIFVNNTTVATSYTIAGGTNGFSVGPMTVAAGQNVTVASGQRWVIL